MATNLAILTIRDTVEEPEIVKKETLSKRNKILLGLPLSILYFIVKKMFPSPPSESISLHCGCISYELDYSDLIVLDLKGKIFWRRRLPTQLGTESIIIIIVIIK